MKFYKLPYLLDREPFAVGPAVIAEAFAAGFTVGPRSEFAGIHGVD